MSVESVASRTSGLEHSTGSVSAQRRNACLGLSRKAHYSPDRGVKSPGLGLRETRATLYNRVGVVIYNRVGVVKRHLQRRRFLFFPFVEDFVFAVALAFVFAHATKARLQNPAVELGSTNHLSDHSTSDHDSLFELPDSSGRQGAQSAQR